MKYVIAGLLLVVHSMLKAQEWKAQEWPVLKQYDQEHLNQIALPLGGIGTGTVSLGGRGELRDWQIMNRPAIGYSTVVKGNDAPFFCIYSNQKGVKKAKALIGPLNDNEYTHYEGRPVNHHGIPRFSAASFEAAYPFGQVSLSDSEMPVKVKIKGFNPLIPCNEESSGLPIAILCYEITNLTSSPVDISVCGSIRNFVGKDGSKIRKDWKGDLIPTGAKSNINVYRSEKNIKGIFFYSDSVKRDDPAYGTMALTTASNDFVTYRTSSSSNDWANSILDFWDDFTPDGELTEKSKLVDDDPMASLAVKKTIPPNGTRSFVFYLTWHFPNRTAWANEIVGNYYCTKYKDAWDAAERIIPQVPELESKTLKFVNSFCESDYPAQIKEAALFNLSTLRSQTVFRIADGHMMGWEGVMDEFGSCPGSCTHVWNYEQATPFLFGELARTMRDVEFNWAIDSAGLMSFRANLPLKNARDSKNAAADGQMGTIMKFYREWQLCGDNNFLSKYWANVKKALEFAWSKNGWDENRDGVMEGSQHNTMDVNYFGPNGQIGIWYLGALRAAGEMAKIMKDKSFEKQCGVLYLKGRDWIESNLYNGEYYEQKITDPKNFQKFLDLKNNPQTAIPDYQLGSCCLVDQLVGQYMSHICNLGYLVSPDHVKTALKSIMKYNYRIKFGNHFNNMRSYVMGDEAGLVMGSWPKGRLEVPFPYFSESMTGFEYCAATGMIYEGLTEEGLLCIKNIRDRFDGRKRNPFDEPECGHHYARAMASWSGVLAWSGFQYSGVDKSMTFTSKPGKYFWSNGYSWGTCEIQQNKAILTVLNNKLVLKNFKIQEGKTIKFKKEFVLNEGESRVIEWSHNQVKQSLLKN